MIALVLKILAIWFALNIALVLALYFKPLGRSRRYPGSVIQFRDWKRT